MITQGWCPGMTLEHVEKEAILAAYKFYRENKTQTAASLGIAIRTLDYKIAKYQAEEAAKQERRNEVSLSR